MGSPGSGTTAAPASPSEAAPADTMQLDLRGVIDAVRRQYRLILAVAALTTAAAAVIAFNSPRLYTAWALVRMHDFRSPLTRGVVDASDAGARVSTTDPLRSEIQVLTSRSLVSQVVAHPGALPVRAYASGFPQGLLRVVSAAPVDTVVSLTLRFGPQAVAVHGGGREQVVAYGELVDVGVARFAITAPPEVPEGGVVVIPIAAAVDSLLSGLQVLPRAQTDLLDVGFTALDPDVAASVANAVVEVFQSASVDRAQQQARRRRIFMEEQLRQNDSILSAAQTALSEFRGRTRAYSSQEMFATNQQALADIDLQRVGLEGERQTHRALLASLTAAGASEGAGTIVLPPGAAANPVVSHHFAQLLRYQSAYDSLTTGEWRHAESSPDIQRLRDLMASSRAQLVDAVGSYVRSLDARIQVLDGLKSTQAAAFRNLPDAEVEEVQLAMRLETLRKIGDQLRGEYQKTRIDEAVEAGQLQIIDAAIAPRWPSGLGPLYKLGIGLVLGLILGGGAAFLRESLNTAIRRREEVEDLLQLPWLAVIPRIRPQPGGHGRRLSWPGARQHGHRSLATAGGATEREQAALGERAFAADAFRILQVNLGFATEGEVPHVIAVTSATAQDGKTTTAINLAAVYAEHNARVLLVDCDLRRPRLHRLSRQPRDPGLVELLLGRHEPAEVIRQLTGNLWLLAAGAMPPNPPALLGSSRMRELLEQLAREYDILVLDCPPALLGADAAVVGTLADGVLFVVRAGRTDRALAQDALRQLRRVGVRVLGAALNDPEATMPQYSYDANESYREYYYQQTVSPAQPAKVN